MARISILKEGTWTKMLKAIPIYNSAARIEVNQPNKLVLSVPADHPKWVRWPVTWFYNPSPRKKYELDMLGEKVWRYCDGVSNVESIIDCFAADYDLSFHEARISITGYISQLIKRGILAIVINDETTGVAS